MRRHLDARRKTLGITQPAENANDGAGGDGEAPATGGRILTPETDRAAVPVAFPDPDAPFSEVNAWHRAHAKTDPSTSR
jgi:hypothetical protein